MLKQFYTVIRDSRRPQRGYKPIPATAPRPPSWNGNGNGRQPAPASSFSDEDTEEEDEFDRDEQLLLQTTRTRESIIAIDRPRGELLVVMLEEAAVLGQVGIHVAILLTGAWSAKGQVAAAANLATWVYIALLASFRLLFSTVRRLSFPRVWYHTAFLYAFMWLFTTMTFRSEMLHPRSWLAKRLSIADFSLVSLLLLISLTSRKGNKAVELEYEGDLTPSKEQTASVLSIATFGWLDELIYLAYRQKGLEIADVWNLSPRDKSASVLADYRQLKKTNILAWHLVKYFKRGLLIQGAWAAFSGFLTFAPTLLLKVILEYVERPDMTPVNAAWFFVVLLFASGCASALADGQALWIGRKLCIRLRAVIVGEIYAKALKRKVAIGGAERVLGQKQQQGGKDDEAKPSLIKRALTFGRKKKDADKNKKPDEATAEGLAGSDAQVSSGTIINLMAVDSFKVAEISAYLHFLWANTPVQVTLAIVLLYRILGYSSIAGISMMFILLPINLTISKKFASIQKQILAATDARINTTNEVLSNIRIIKYFAWEQRFMGLVNEKRKTELKHLRRRYTWWAVAATVWSGAPVLITFFSFFVYTVIEKRQLVPSIAFTALSLFQILRIPLDQLADMIAHVQESKVSVDRIEEFLNEPETEKYRQLRSDLTTAGEGKPLIGFDNGLFTWGGRDMREQENADAFKLSDLNLEFLPGQLNVVVGPTGSGKTSLLMALLGEMTCISGRVFLPHPISREEADVDEDGLTESVAYCAQSAWLVNGTIKENITFASPWNPQRYNDAIMACSLLRDLEILDKGDQTIVGEKGVTLSGGQKQRISLARALYSKARHVLLDDVLSAVDSHTAKWIFDHALMGPLMYKRTCILVTHNIGLCLPQSEFAVVLENGKVVAQGSADEVIASGKLGEDLTKSRNVSRAPSTVPSRVPSDVGEEETEGENGHTNGAANGKPAKTREEVQGDSSAIDEQAEIKAVGSVKFSIILLYLRAMGSWWYWVFAATGFALQQVSSVATNVWVRQWANAYAYERESANASYHRHSPVTHVSGISSFGSCLRSGTCIWTIPFRYGAAANSTILQQQQHGFAHAAADTKPAGVNPIYYLTVYGILGIAYMCVTLAREGILFNGSLTASRRIHQRLMESVTHAKFRFFDQTPLGQLMNRFSKDVESVDQEIAPVAVGVVHCLASIITIVVLISVITPGFLIAGFFITVLYFLIGKFYITASRDLKRLESIARTPLFQQFGETLSGMTTIRAYGDERRFIRDNLSRINTHNRPFIFLWAANRWLAFRVDVVGALVSFFAGVFVLLSVGRIDAGAAGLAMTYAVSFTENVLWFVRLYAANEQNMNSVERIKEYLDVEQEADMIVPDNRPAANWPSKGSVEFIGYSTRYRADHDFVLRQLTFKIRPGEKVGIVGRTGAGKSSLALALFRALEAEEGKILIDDVDIGLIGLQDLRENIVMVPQGKIHIVKIPWWKYLSKMLTMSCSRPNAIHWYDPQQPGSVWPLYRR